MATKATPPEIPAIDALARQYADAQTDLEGLTRDLKVEIDQVVRKYWTNLRKATTRAAERYEALYGAVSEAKAAFENPKARILHGVRVGYRKSQDKVVVPNSNNTIALIRKHLPDQQDVLIATDARVVMDALDQLNDKQLATVGARREPGKNEPFVRIADTDVDKVVAALMKGAIEKAEAES